jgi:hypothetical protein
MQAARSMSTREAQELVQRRQQERIQKQQKFFESLDEEFPALTYEHAPKKPQEPSTPGAQPFPSTIGKPAEEETCSICLLEFKGADVVRSLPCNVPHIFHRPCIDEWFRTHTECPLCKFNYHSKLAPETPEPGATGAQAEGQPVGTAPAPAGGGSSDVEAGSSSRRPVTAGSRRSLVAPEGSGTRSARQSVSSSSSRRQSTRNREGDAARDVPQPPTTVEMTPLAQDMIPELRFADMQPQVIEITAVAGRESPRIPRWV